MNTLNLSSETVSGYTAVSDIFIDRYVPSANGDFVKIYLYLLRLNAGRGRDLSVSSLADIFNQTENDVLRALKYWDKLGLLALSYDKNKELCGITIRELKTSESPEPDNRQRNSDDPASISDSVLIGGDSASDGVFSAANGAFLASGDTFLASTDNVLSIDRGSVRGSAHSVQPSKVSVSPEKLDELSGNDEFRMLLYVVRTYLAKELSPAELNSVVYFYDTLHFPADLIEYLFEYCVSKGKTSLRYIEKVALSWADAGVNTVEAAKNEIFSHTEAVYRVMQAFGLKNREPGLAEKQFITKWTDCYLFDVDMIVEACNRTLRSIHQPSFEYADSILTKWNNHNVRNSEDIKKDDELFEASKPAKASDSRDNTVIKQNAERFNNYRQRPKKSDEWYNAFLSNNS